MLLIAEENPKVVSERLGHSTIVLTLDTYSHVLPLRGLESDDKVGDAAKLRGLKQGLPGSTPLIYFICATTPGVCAQPHPLIIVVGQFRKGSADKYWLRNLKPAHYSKFGFEPYGVSLRFPSTKLTCLNSVPVHSR